MDKVRTIAFRVAPMLIAASAFAVALGGRWAIAAGGRWA
jgi:hypothetical protein